MTERYPPPLYCYLAYAGALPFVFAVGCLLLGVQSLPWLGSVTHLLSFYGLVIASFMAGAHWGQHLAMPAVQGRSLALSSNLMAVMLWLSMVFTLPIALLLLMLMVVFVLLLLIDYRLYHHKIISMVYLRTRGVVTAIVVTNLSVALWLVWGS